MKFPKAITVIDASYLLDGGTMTLYALTDSGLKCQIRLNQRAFDSYPDPGRLYFNDQLIDIRSDDESTILELLKTASIISKDRLSSPSENRISKKALILGDDIKEVLENSPEDNLRKFRDNIITFVESDEYVHIAEHGPPKLQ